jgi:hypothetical protein
MNQGPALKRALNFLFSKLPCPSFQGFNHFWKWNSAFNLALESAGYVDGLASSTSENPYYFPVALTLHSFF